MTEHEEHLIMLQADTAPTAVASKMTWVEAEFLLEIDFEKNSHHKLHTYRLLCGV